MSLKRAFFGFLLLSSSLFANEACIPVCECPPAPCRGSTSLSNRSPGGIGYDHGYSSIDLFYAGQADESYFPFLDIRGHVFNNGKPAFNAGLGLRYLACDSELVCGVNAYWDYKEARHTSFHQLGLGAEFLWPYWDIHLNGYIPLNGTKKGYRSGFDKFKGNSAFVYRKYETAMSGFEATFGLTLFNCPCFELRTLFTGYYLRGDFRKDAGGVRFALRTLFWDRLSAEGSISYDNEFKARPQGELALRFPFGPKVCRNKDRVTSCCPAYLSLEDKLTRKPERFEIIASTTKKKRKIARDPDTGAPLHFIFVDNTSGSNGTFEDPFATLEDAFAVSGPNNVIYVLPGNSSYLPAADLIMQEGQRFIGSATPFAVRGSGIGRVDIPAQTTNRPNIQLQNDATIFLANRTFIAGHRIEKHAGSQAILNNSASTESYSIINNRFFVVDEAIHDIGSAIARRIKIENNVAFALSDGATFFRLIPTGPTHQIALNTISNQFFTDFSGAGAGFNIAGIVSNNAPLIIENNELNRYVVFFTGAEPQGGLLLQKNLARGGAGSDVGILVNAGSEQIIVSNNLAFSETDYGMAADVSDANDTGRFKWMKNRAFSPADTGFLYSGTAGPLFIQSPNLAQSGLDGINTGTSTTSGTITYLPFE